MHTPHERYKQAHLAAEQQRAPASEARGRWNTEGQKVQEFLQSFYQENLGPIYRFVYSKIGNREEAEDLTSEIFVKALRSIDTKRTQQSRQKWLFQVARTTLADYWRVYYRAPVSSLDEMLEVGWEGPVDEDPIIFSEIPAERVQRILNALSAPYREVLTCRFLLNLSIKETATRMKLTEANVKVLQFRAIKCAADLESVVTGISETP